MFWLLFLSAILAIVAQCQIDSCTFKYYTVNTYDAQKSFNFTCYGVNSDCKVYYTPRGNGCNGDLPTYIGTVSENETQVFTSDFEFELGGGFCSNNQIGVYYFNAGLPGINDTQGYLPRATEAGRYFFIPVSVDKTPVEYECVISALSSGANPLIGNNGDVNRVEIDPFGVYKFKLVPRPSFSTFAKIYTGPPVIVSCIGTKGLVTLQPTSFEPLLLVANPSEYVSVMISEDRSTTVTTDFSKVKVRSMRYSDGSSCPLLRHHTEEIQVFSFRPIDNCVIFVEPLDNFLVSMVAVERESNIVSDVGLPESKFSTRFANDPDVNSINLLSFLETTCTGFSDKYEQQPFHLTWLGPDLPGKVSFVESINISQFSRVECANPVLAVAPERNMKPYLSGYQSEELWEPFFQSTCSEAPPNFYSVSPLDVDTDGSSEGPAGNNTDALPIEDPAGNNPDAPNSSDARSLVSCISWAAFFGLHLFSSSLV